MNRVVAADGVFGNENLKAAFKTFSGGGADAGVKMNARENHRVAIHPPERGIKRCAGKRVEAGFVDDRFRPLAAAAGREVGVRLCRRRTSSDPFVSNVAAAGLYRGGGWSRHG